MAVKTINTKVIRRFMLNHVLNHHFSEKQPSKKLHIQLFKIFFQGLFGQCRILGSHADGSWRRPRRFVLIGASPAKDIESLKLKVK